MPELYEEHSEEQEKQFLARQKSRRRIRALLISVNAILIFYLCFFTGKAIYDSLKDVDNDIVTLCGMSASKSKARYASLASETDEIGDYLVYGNYLNLSDSKMDARSYVPVVDLQLSNVCKSTSTNEILVPVKDAAPYFNGGLDLFSLEKGDYLLKRNSKAIKVASGKDKNVNVVYSLPDEKGRRKCVKVYSYPKNPCLVISVSEVNKLPANYYDFVVVGDQEMTDEASKVLNKYSVKVVGQDSSLSEINSYETSYVIKLEEIAVLANSVITNSRFVSSTFSCDIDDSTKMANYDASYFIRELGGRVLGGNTKDIDVEHSFDLGSSRGEYDNGREVFIVSTSVEGVASRLSTVVDFIES